MSYLILSVHNYPKGIISRLSPRQSHAQIHSNLFPTPLRYLQGLQPSSKSLLLGLNFLTWVTKGNIRDSISFHSVPPIGCIVTIVHLISPWVNGISGHVSLSKYLTLQFLDIRHTNPSFVPQHTLVIFRKRRLLFLNITLYPMGLLVFMLTFLYIPT
jgi:hypothetical protein